MKVERIQERRNHTRVEISGKVYHLSDETFYPLESDEIEYREEKVELGQALNIGIGGALLETDSPFSPFTELTLSIHVDGQEVELTGKITRVIECQSGKIKLGVEFLDVTGDARQKLRRYVKAIQRHFSPNLN